MLNDISLPNEIWKKLPEFDNYLISNFGRIWSEYKKQVMKDWKINSGYRVIQILDNKGSSVRFLVHRLVAYAFISQPKNKKYINHKDGNKENNAVDNLEWVSMSENIKHARDTGLNPYNFPTRNKKLNGQRKGTSKFYGVAFDKSRNKWRSVVVYNGKNYKQKRFNTEIEAAKHYNQVVIEMGLENIKTLNNI